MSREISVRTCAVLYTHTHTHTHTHASFSLSCVFVITMRPVIMPQTNTHSLFTLSPSCRLASLDACTRRPPTTRPTQRPILKLMKWKSPGNVWPLNMFPHIVQSQTRALCQGVVSLGVSGGVLSRTMTARWHSFYLMATQFKKQHTKK